MKNELKNNFMQAAFGTMIWVLVLSTIFIPNQTITAWNLIGIGTVFAFTFGIIYPYLWNYSTFKAPVNIIISTIANVVCGFSGLYLYSVEMFRFVQPYAVGMIVLTLIGHIIGFYFYSGYKNRQLTKALNGQLQ